MAPSRPLKPAEYLGRFAKLPLSDQEAIAGHLTHGEQRRLADWLDENSPQILRLKLSELKARLAGNSPNIRSRILRNVARKKLTEAAHTSLNAQLSLAAESRAKK